MSNLIYFIRQKKDGAWRYFSDGRFNHSWLQEPNMDTAISGNAIDNISQAVTTHFMLSKNLPEGERENLEIAEVQVTYSEPYPAIIDAKEKAAWDSIARQNYNFQEDNKRRQEEEDNKPLNRFLRWIRT